LRGAYFLKSFVSLDAALDSYFLRLRKLRSADIRCLVIAAMPKTGSTFLSHIMCKLLGYQHSYFASAYYNIEQELYQPRIVDAYGRGTVVQQHIRANAPNLELFRRYGLRPTVLVRNLFDVLASLRDHLNRERLDNIPSLYVPAGYREMSPERQFDFLVSFYAPWLLSFYASWVEAERHQQLEFMWLRYEDCLPDYATAVRAMVDFHRLGATPQDIEAALRDPGDQATRRFNKGVAGRGLALLTPTQLRTIEDMARCYGTVDFRPIGIPQGT
jgi:hypothetical protein